jgi:hypothetical protein
MSRSKVSSFAKVDPAHLLDGLFTPTAKKGEALYEVEGSFGGLTIAFKGVQMSVTHQSMLLAISARTARQPKAISVLVTGNATNLQHKHVKQLTLTGKAESMDVSIVSCTAYSLLVDAGMNAGGKAYEAMINMLHEMSTVTMYRGAGLKGGSSRLISFSHDGDQFKVSFNWRMADAILGKQNVQVSLHERNFLKRYPVAKILHAWLSAHIRLGGQLMAGRGAEIDTLIRHVWGNRPCSHDVIKKRRSRIKEALNEIGKLNGWVYRLEGSHAFISRPKELSGIEKCELSPGDVAEFELEILEDLYRLSER